MRIILLIKYTYTIYYCSIFNHKSVQTGIINMKKKTLLIPIAISILFYALLFYRIFFSVSLHDEAYNIAEALRIAKGDLPFIDVWDFYHMGDLINVPFLYLYISITKSTEGIFLFSRLVYLCFVSLESIIIFIILSKMFHSKESGATAFLLIFYAPFSLYYFWYDTSMMHFSILIILLFSYACIKEGTHRKGLFIISGFLHACAVYSYPTMLLVTISLLSILIAFSYKHLYKIKVSDIFSFIGGGSLLLILFFLYAFVHQNYTDFFFLNSELLSSTLNNRSTTLKEHCAQILLLFKSMAKQMQWSILPSAILLILFYKNYYKPSKKYLCSFLVGLCTTTIVFLFNPTQTTSIIYSFWLAIWSPFLFYLLPIELRTMYKSFFTICSTSSFFGTIGMLLISLGSDVKIFLATLPNTIFSVAIIILLLQKHFSPTKRHLLALCFPFTYLALFWLTTFTYYPITSCTVQAESGI